MKYESPTQPKLSTASVILDHGAITEFSSSARVE